MNARWEIFSAAPHRMMFLGGAVQLVAVLAFWFVELAGRYTGWWAPLPAAIFTTWAHAFLMLFALFPFFMFGFLMTTYPRWMGGEVIPRARYARAFLLMAPGVAAFYVGLFLGKALLIAGVILLLAGWAFALLALFHVYRHAPARDKHYETVLNLALTAGWIGAFAFLLWLATDLPGFYEAAREIGLWLFLVPVLVTVAHRMIPFFSSNVIQNYRVVQPAWSLPLLGVCTIGHTLLVFAGLEAWTFAFDAPLAFMAWHHTVRWRLVASFAARLLAMLHVAFAWLGIAMTLYTVQSLALLLTGTAVLGKAPLHALGIGFIASMTIAMASRVTLGHSGRALVADGFTWACFLGVSATALLRIGAELPALADALGIHLNIVSAAAWLACITPWVLRYGAIYLRPRIDGRPG